MGILRSQVNISDLEIIDEPVITGKHLQKTSSGKMKMKKTMSVRPEINLLGKTVDEAIAELDKYLDDAYMSHISPVRIVHGKGTGALRSGIHNYLKRQKHVNLTASVRSVKEMPASRSWNLSSRFEIKEGFLPHGN